MHTTKERAIPWGSPGAALLMNKFRIVGGFPLRRNPSHNGIDLIDLYACSIGNNRKENTYFTLLPTLKDFKREVTKTELPGVRYSPTNDLSQFEQTLSISFPTDRKPLKAVLTGDNMSAILSSGQFDKPELAAAVGALAVGDTRAVYLSDFYTLFTYPNAPFFVKGHEYFHAWTDIENPNIVANIAAINNTHKMENKDSVEIYGDVERAHVLYIFIEGSAAWADIQCSIAAGKVEEARIRHNYRLTGVGDSRSFSPPVDHFIARQLADLKEGIAYETEQIINGSNDKYIYSGTQYSLGYYFFNLAIRELTGRGFSQADAIRLLVHNPPTRVQHLRNPVAFAQAITHLRS